MNGSHMSMTPEELEALTKSLVETLTPKMAEIANAASTAQIKRLEKQLAETQAKAAPETPKPEAPKVAPEVEAGIKADPKLAVMQAQIEEITKRYEAEAQARKAAEDKARNDSAYNALRSSLTGVRDGMQDIAAKMLMQVENRVTFDAAGNPLFKVKRQNALGVVEDQEMPLSDGVGFWLKSKDAAPFLPAPGAQPGSGVGGRAPVAIPNARSANGMPVYDNPATNDVERIARAAEREAAMKKLGIE